MVLFIALFSLAACVAGTDVPSAARPSSEETYQGEAQSAKKAVQRIWDLRHSVEMKARQTLDDKVKQAEQRAESDLGFSLKQLSDRFISAEKDAASQVAKSNLDAAKENLQRMEETDMHLKEISQRTAWELERMSRNAEDLGRDSARAAEEEVDGLTREARRQTDSLSRVARKYDMPDLSDRFDRAATDAARKVQDAAERGARLTEDAARALPREFGKKQRQAERSRKRAIEITRELISSAEKKEAGASPAILISNDGGNVLALVVLAAAAGAASAVVAALVMRRSEDEVEDKYLLVV